MSDQLSEDRPTVRAHKRQFAWQILVPFLVITMLIIAGALLVTTGGTDRTSVWADVSMIWLLIPALLFAFALLVVIITIIYGMIKILQIIPHYTGKTQDIFSRVSTGTRKIADGTTKPFFWYKQAGAVIKSIFRR
jgi:predicted membrane protein